MLTFHQEKKEKVKVNNFVERGYVTMMLPFYYDEFINDEYVQL